MKARAETPRECLGLALRGWRLDHGLNQLAAAERLGVSQSSYSRMEAGKAPFDVLVLERAGVVVRDFLAAARLIAVQDSVRWPE